MEPMEPMKSMKSWRCWIIFWLASCSVMATDSPPPSPPLLADFDNFEPLLLTERDQKPADEPALAWAPVCEELLVHRSIETVVQQPMATTGLDDLLNSTKNAKDCAPPNGQGLRSLIDSARELLPLDKIKGMVLKAANDKELRDLKHLLTSGEFGSRLLSLYRSRHFAILQDYACQSMHFRLQDYGQFVQGLLNITATLEQASAQSHGGTGAGTQTGHPGIAGLLLDIRQLVPEAQLRDLFRKQLQSDKYLAHTMAQFDSVEFRQLWCNFQRLKEFQELYEMLVAVGVPMQDLKQLVDVALGWQADDSPPLIDFTNATHQAPPS